MSNMSYCRFNNTTIDIKECIDAIQNNEETSAEEKAKAKRMFGIILDFFNDYGIETKEDINEVIDTELS